MNLYICRRSKNWEYEWMGALLIVAPDQETARKIYSEDHYAHEDPEAIEIVEGVKSIGEPRIIYNDECR